MPFVCVPMEILVMFEFPSLFNGAAYLNKRRACNRYFEHSPLGARWLRSRRVSGSRETSHQISPVTAKKMEFRYTVFVAEMYMPDDASCMCRST